LTIDGLTNLDALTTIDLSNPANNFGGEVSFSGTNVKIVNGNVTITDNPILPRLPFLYPDTDVTLKPPAPRKLSTSQDSEAPEQPVSSSVITQPAPTFVVTAVSSSDGADSPIIRLSAEIVATANFDILPVGNAFKLDIEKLGSRRIKSLVMEIEQGLVPGTATFEFDSGLSLVVVADNSNSRITITGEASAEEFDRAIKTVVLRLKDGSVRPSNLTVKLVMTDENGSKESRTVNLSGK
jgi:hypothetical protein